MLGRNLINFAKGNIAGAAAATKSVLYARPVLVVGTALVKCVPAKTPSQKFGDAMLLFNAIRIKKSIPDYLNHAFASNGAPKSGEFWTQSVSSFFKNILPKK